MAGGALAHDSLGQEVVIRAANGLAPTYCTRTAARCSPPILASLGHLCTSARLDPSALPNSGSRMGAAVVDQVRSAAVLGYQTRHACAGGSDQEAGFAGGIRKEILQQSGQRPRVGKRIGPCAGSDAIEMQRSPKRVLMFKCRSHLLASVPTAIP